MQLRSDERPRYNIFKKTLNDDCSLNHGYGIRNWSVCLLINFEFANFDQIINRLSLNFSEDRVLFLQPITRRSHRHEELGAILIPLPFVGHSDDSSVREGESLMKLIHERFAISAFTAMTSPSWVTALNHKVLNHPMKHCLVIVAFKTQLDKVTASTGSLTSPQVNFYFAIIRLKNNFG